MLGMGFLKASPKEHKYQMLLVKVCKLGKKGQLCVSKYR